MICISQTSWKRNQILPLVPSNQGADAACNLFSCTFFFTSNLCLPLSFSYVLKKKVILFLYTANYCACDFTSLIVKSHVMVLATIFKLERKETMHLLLSSANCAEVVFCHLLCSAGGTTPGMLWND